MHKLLVFTNKDGISVTRYPQRSQARVILAGGPITDLNPIQAEALATLLLGPEGISEEVCFYDGNAWASSEEGIEPLVELLRLTPCGNEIG